ncbi:MAG: hypothetical protein HYS32_03550 [Candidatus Woesearchaeota archaeon]|nr:MAG: hypothetical protein HYS32_03550 [Candidatus Woesearchaeota archaeon]
MNAKMMGWAGIVLGVLVALNVALGWSDSLQYLWAVLVLILGIWSLMGK